MDAKDHRQASLSHWIHKHIASAHPWAGTFFFTDTQSDDAYKRARRVAEMMKPIDSPTLPPGAKHGVSFSLSRTLAHDFKHRWTFVNPRSLFLCAFARAALAAAFVSAASPAHS